MSKEKLEKLEREKYVVERKLTAAMHKEKRLQSELAAPTPKILRCICASAGMRLRSFSLKTSRSLCCPGSKCTR